MNLIMTLPEGLRQVFNLHAVEGFSHKEIGQLLDIKETTSRNNLSKARFNSGRSIIATEVSIYP